MTVVLTVVGVIVCTILVMHTFITGNTMEKNSTDLSEFINRYYAKSAERNKTDAQEEE
jgi:hypothetical protein